MAASDSFEFESTGYGKNSVKLLHVRREGKVHHIRELEVGTQLTLSRRRDYIDGDNRDVIPTDTQKNTVYILAKQLGVNTIERFALQLTDHFLSRYSHVTNVKVTIEQYPWKRVNQDGREHNHAFIFTPDAVRVCEVEQQRHGRPLVMSGLKGMRVLKTTQSAFVKFHQDEYTTLPEFKDRVFSTVVEAKWWYENVDDSTMFSRNWDTVKSCILDLFAGPPDEGLFSPSVQQTLYLAEKRALSSIPQMSKITMVMPNKHYFNVDLTRFKKFGFPAYNDEVFQPVDKPAGNIMATLKRTQKSKL